MLRICLFWFMDFLYAYADMTATRDNIMTIDGEINYFLENDFLLINSLAYFVVWLYKLLGLKSMIMRKSCSLFWISGFSFVKFCEGMDIEYFNEFTGICNLESFDICVVYFRGCSSSKLANIMSFS